ncbi:hypothetical protein LV779_07590 [Streptomyces thinghirensis]|nr:hypothetical protein [Streptomyces thinghirensis]
MAGQWPGLSCHSFTEHRRRPTERFSPSTSRSGDYAGHDGEALARAASVLRHHGMDASVPARALAALTDPRPETAWADRLRPHWPTSRTARRG